MEQGKVLREEQSSFGLDRMEDGRTTGGVAKIEGLAVAWQADVGLSDRGSS